MNIALFGASGMLGQGALQVCLRDPGVERVLCIVRAPVPVQHEKLQQIVHPDFLDFSAIEEQLRRADACLFCLGVSSSGMSEEHYTQVTYGFTLAAATSLLKINPALSFVYISGSGADSGERGRVMWARVKGKTENALLAMPFRAAYMFRPGLIQPLGGIESRTAAYRIFYKLLGPALTLARRLWPAYITTTEELGQAMLLAAVRGKEKRVVEASEIRALLLALSREKNH